MAAVRFLPLGIVAGFVAPVVSKLAGRISTKRIILGSLLLLVISTLMLPFADQKSRYWSIVFPAFILGTSGAMGLYIING
jgi:nitrate/nitrite transporter NarK